MMTETAGTGAVRDRSVFKVNAVVFDLDGTLIHTAPDLARAVNRMRKDLGMSTLPENDVMNWIGNGATRLVKRALTESWDGEPEAELFEKGHALFHRHYLEGVCEHSEPYPDVRDALIALKARGFRLACVTNKPQAFTEPLLEELELDGFFETVISGDSLAKKKPDPLPLTHICDLFGIAPQDAILIGDSVNDVRAAKAAGMPVICVTYGYNQGLDLTKYDPNAIIASFKELADILQTID